jgi:Flp pilus assembly pilin Flp
MFDRLNTLVARLATLDLRREEGQAMAEYALILAVIVIAAAAVMTPLGTAIAGKISAVTGSLGG